MFVNVLILSASFIIIVFPAFEDKLDCEVIILASLGGGGKEIELVLAVLVEVGTFRLTGDSLISAIMAKATMKSLYAILITK